MQFYFSRRTCGFYLREVHGDAMPSDCVPNSGAENAVLFFTADLRFLPARGARRRDAVGLRAHQQRAVRRADGRADAGENDRPWPPWW
nr:MAG TPA: hypothetical protein [Caudoviricetes sp.]